MYLLHENEELDGKSSQRPSSPATSSTKSIVVWPHSVDSPEEEEEEEAIPSAAGLLIQPVRLSETPASAGWSLECGHSSNTVWKTVTQPATVAKKILHRQRPPA